MANWALVYNRCLVSIVPVIYGDDGIEILGRPWVVEEGFSVRRMVGRIEDEERIQRTGPPWPMIPPSQRA